MNMTNEDNIDPLLDIENADFLELSASQEEILVKSLEIALGTVKLRECVYVLVALHVCPVFPTAVCVSVEAISRDLIRIRTG
jgi:hypothetical protein